MNRLSPAKKVQVIAALVEGNSIRATVRMTAASKYAVQRLVWSSQEIANLMEEKVAKAA